MDAEKRLTVKRNNWKMTGANFQFGKPGAAENFTSLCERIDLHLHPPPPRTFGVKDYETEAYYNRAQKEKKEEEDRVRKEKISRLRKAKGFTD